MSHVALRPYLAGLTCAGDVTDREVSQSLSVGWHCGTLNLKVFGPGFNSTFPWFITSSLSTPHLPVFIMNTSCLIIRLPFHANWWMFPRSKLCGSTIISWALEEPLQENSLTVRCNFPGLQQVWWSTVWIKWSDSHWQWFGFILSLSLPHSFSSHRINFGHICPYKNGCHQCLLKKYKLLDRRLLRWEYKVWEGDMEKKKKKRTKAELENARWGKEWEVKTMSVKWTAGKNCVE